jgi:hypothetical protein
MVSTVQNAVHLYYIPLMCRIQIIFCLHHQVTIGRLIDLNDEVVAGVIHIFYFTSQCDPSGIELLEMIEHILEIRVMVIMIEAIIYHK